MGPTLATELQAWGAWPGLGGTAAGMCGARRSGQATISSL